MPPCKGCSRTFRRLPQQMCETCRDRQKGTPNLHPQCRGCGETFIFLEGKLCEQCSADEDELGEFDLAMQSPVNARGQVHLFQPITPITPAVTSGDAELQRRSAEILSRYKSSHTAAITHAITANKYQPKKAGFGKNKMEPPKISKAGDAVMVHVKAVQLNGKKAQGIPAFDLHCQYEETFVSVVRRVREALDQKFMMSPVYGYRISESVDIQILFHKLESEVPATFHKETIRYVWKYVTTYNNKSRFMTAADMSNRMLPIIVNLVYTQADSPSVFESRVQSKSGRRSTVTAQSFTSVSTGVKRKPSEDLAHGSSVKRPLAYLSSASPFDASVHNAVERYTDAVMEQVETSYDGTKSYFVTVKGKKLIVEVDATESARGATKSMHKGYVNGELRAFKSYHLPLSKEDAYKYNKEEALRCATLRRCVDQYSIDALTYDIAIPDIGVLVPDIIKISEGPDAMKTWLCDKYIDGVFKKFSGTNEAGDGTDLFSKVVNALAHYVAEQTDWMLVPADLQGQLEERISDGVVNYRKLHLYDIQFHTIHKTSGLGDHGPAGIKTFAAQHKCNDICKHMRLTTALTSIGSHIEQLDEAQEKADKGKLSVTESAPLQFSIRRGYPKKEDNVWGIETPPPGELRMMRFFDSHDRCGPYNLHWGYVKTKNAGDYIILFDLAKVDREWEDLGCSGRDYWNFMELGRMETFRETATAFMTLAEQRGATVHGLEVVKFVIEDVRDVEGSTSSTERDAGWLVADPMTSDTQGVPCNVRPPKLHILSSKDKPQGDYGDSNLLNDTLAALSHFSLNRNSKLCVDCDFCYYLSTNETSNAIANIMYFTTHSARGNRSLDDQGLKGIVDFRRRHACNDICKALALDRKA